MGEFGELKIGFMMHAAFTVVPKFTRSFISAHPKVKLHLKEIVPSALPEDIMSGRIDAGILFYPGIIRGMTFRVIHSERLCLAVPIHHPLAKKQKIRPAMLKDEALVASSEEVAPTLRAAILAWFAKSEINPKIRLETQLQQTLISFVSEGLGIALVPQSMAKLGVVGVTFRSLEEAPLIDHGIAWREGNPNPSLELFLRVCGVGC
jgi:DNA-binding transcriptional LysR family regulator